MHVSLLSFLSITKITSLADVENESDKYFTDV